MQALVDILLLIKTLMRQKILSSPLPLTMKLTALWDNHSDCQSSMVLSYVSCVCTYVWAAVKGLAREQAIRGALACGAGKGRRACNYVSRIYNEYLHQKRRCRLLIGGDDISNDVITLGTCFSMFVYIRTDWRKSDSSVNQEPKGKWRWNSNLRLSKDQVSDAFGLNSTKSRETAGVVVLVFFFPKATRRPTATRAKKIIL